MIPEINFTIPSIPNNLVCGELFYVPSLISNKKKEEKIINLEHIKKEELNSTLLINNIIRQYWG